MAGFEKAKKTKVATKVLLGGVSGCGKTYSALRLATGLVSQTGGRIAFIDTEGDRGTYYADDFDFDRMELDQDHRSPEDYIDAIHVAEEAGYKVLVIDSTSHEWNYCTDLVNKMNGNSFTNWGKVTPRHDAFLAAMLESPMHIICTARGKAAYEIEDKNGKKVPKKIGMGIKQREGVEFEFTVMLDLSNETHIATTSKDNTKIFEGKYNVLTEKDGVALYKWANSGDEPAPKKIAVPKEPTELVDFLELIDKQAKALSTSTDEKKKVVEIIKEVCGFANYNKITDIDMAKKLLERLNK